MKRLLICAISIVALLATSSCSIFKNNINSEQTYLSVEIFQTLSKDSALAHTTGWDYDVVKIITSEDVYYDGTKEQWEKIKIYDGNDSLLSAELHFAE